MFLKFKFKSEWITRTNFHLLVASVTAVVFSIAGPSWRHAPAVTAALDLMRWTWTCRCQHSKRTCLHSVTKIKLSSWIFFFGIKWPPCGKGRSGQSNLDDEQNRRRKEKLPATILTDKVLINRSKTKLWISKEFALKRLLWADIFRWLDGASVSKRRQMAGRVTISLPVLTPHTNNTHTALVQVN